MWLGARGQTAILSSGLGSLPDRATFQGGPEGGKGGRPQGQQLEKSILAEGWAAKAEAQGRSACCALGRARPMAGVWLGGGVSSEARGQEAALGPPE